MSLISHSINVYYFCILNRSEAGYLELVKVNTVIMMFVVQQFNVIYYEESATVALCPQAVVEVMRLKYYPFVATCVGVVC